MLQEIKIVDEAFPRLEIEDLGYNLETHGQKGFNGVAILSKLPLEDVRRGLPGDDADEQARWIEATVTGPLAAVRICGLYLPNGNPAPGLKYDYKLAWMDRLEARCAALVAGEDCAVIAGDYNVIPEPEDCHDVAVWREDALYDLIGVLGWNDAPVVRGRGSAIFLHLARPDLAPTEGCVALAERDLRAALAAGLTAIEVRPG